MKPVSKKKNLTVVRQTRVRTENLVNFLIKIEPETAVLFLKALFDSSDGKNKINALCNYFSKNNLNPALSKILDVFAFYYKRNIRQLESKKNIINVSIRIWTVFDSFRLEGILVNIKKEDTLLFERKVLNPYAKLKEEKK
jgi:hypothetical protein